MAESELESFFFQTGLSVSQSGGVILHIESSREHLTLSVVPEVAALVCQWTPVSPQGLPLTHNSEIVLIKYTKPQTSDGDDWIIARLVKEKNQVRNILTSPTSLDEPPREILKNLEDS